MSCRSVRGSTAAPARGIVCRVGTGRSGRRDRDVGHRLGPIEDVLPEDTPPGRLRACVQRVPQHRDGDEGETQSDLDRIHEGDEPEGKYRAEDRRHRVERHPEVRLVLGHVGLPERDQREVHQAVDDQVEHARGLGQDLEVLAERDDEHDDDAAGQQDRPIRRRILGVNFVEFVSDDLVPSHREVDASRREDRRVGTRGRRQHRRQRDQGDTDRVEDGDPRERDFGNL